MTNQTFPSWPAEVRGAMMTKDYTPLTFREQWLASVQDNLEKVKIEYSERLQKFKDLKGTMEYGTDENGQEIRNEMIFTLGSTTMFIELDENMMPNKCIHAFDLKEKPIVTSSEAETIINTLEAIIWHESTDKAILALELGKANVRNAHTVNGIQDLMERAKNNPILINNAIAGANIERVQNDG